MNEQETTAWAERFWRLAGCGEPFPRSLESAVSWALPLALVKLPHLGLLQLQDWLASRGVSLRLPRGDRPLRACLVARAGCGLVFLDGSDPDDERRFSLAHEVAHFLLHYLRPREKALAAVGEQVRDVLDGRRMPTPEERLAGVLRGVELGTFTHLMDRRASGMAGLIQVVAAEDDADLLALELLAPRSEIVSRLAERQLAWRDHAATDITQQLLVEHFGLPERIAERYSQMLVMAHRASRSFQEWLGG